MFSQVLRINICVYDYASVYVYDVYHYQQALSVPIPCKALYQEPDQHQVIILANIFLKPLKRIRQPCLFHQQTSGWF